jgi:hypothetical protein
MQKNGKGSVFRKNDQNLPKELEGRTFLEKKSRLYLFLTPPTPSCSKRGGDFSRYFLYGLPPFRIRQDESHLAEERAV